MLVSNIWVRMVSNHSCTLYQTEEMKADWIACKTTSSVVFHFRLHWWIWFFPKLLLHYYLHHTLLLSSLRIFSVTVNTKIWKRSEDHRFFFFPEYSNNFFYIKHVLVAVILKKLVLPKKVLWSIVDLLTSFIILEYILVLIMLLLAGIQGQQFISFH